jgi:hypothetical protein
MAEGPLQLQVEIGLEPDADAAELDEETLELRQELLELDVNAVERPAAGPPPEGARAIELALLGTLLVTAGQEAIGPVVRAIADWMTRRHSRSVKLTLGGDSIEATDLSDEDQRRLLEAFLARHTTGGETA